MHEKRNFFSWRVNDRFGQKESQDREENTIRLSYSSSCLVCYVRLIPALVFKRRVKETYSCLFHTYICYPESMKYTSSSDIRKCKRIEKTSRICTGRQGDRTKRRRRQQPLSHTCSLPARNNIIIRSNREEKNMREYSLHRTSFPTEYSCCLTTTCTFLSASPASSSSSHLLTQESRHKE